MSEQNTILDQEELLRQLLRQNQLELNSLLEVSQAINDNLPSEALFKIYEFILTDQLKVENLLVLANEGVWNVFCNYGGSYIDVNEKMIKNLSKYDKITNISEHKLADFKDYEILLPIHHKQTPLAYIFLGKINSTGFDSFMDKLKFIQTITNLIMIAIQNKSLVRTQIEQEGMKRELELASKVQNTLVPNALPSNSYVDMAKIYLPHANIGGDYFDVIQLNEDEYAFCIADIAGKGVSAAMLMANFQANYRILISEPLPPEDLIHQLNQVVLNITKGERFITLFTGVYNVKTRILTYVNAGHNPPILVMNGTTHLLKDGCTLLGIFDRVPNIKHGEIRLQENALLVNYTDGLTELRNKKGKQYQDERLIDFVEQNNSLDSESFNNLLLEEINEFKNRGQFQDDITVLTCRFY